MIEQTPASSSYDLRMSLYYMYILASLLSLGRAAQQPLLSSENGDPSIDAQYPFHDSFNAFAESTLSHLHVPGCSIAVIHKNITFSTAYGYAHLGDATSSGVPATASTVYFTASTTKSFTAAALSLLMHDQSLNTSIQNPLTRRTPISAVIPSDFVLGDSYLTAHVTLEDAASHRTGLGGHDLCFGGPGMPNAKASTRALRHLPLTAPFRTTFQYNNMMWGVLQHVAETVSGQWLGDLLHTRVWEQLQMANTYFSIPDAVRKEGKKLARGYYWDNETQQHAPVPYYDNSAVAGAGAIISTVLDYIKYLRMMLHETLPLPPSVHAELQKARSIFSASPYEGLLQGQYQGRGTYSLGWIQQTYHGIDFMQHSGGIPGFGTLMIYAPALDWGCVIMGNTGMTSAYASLVLFHRLLDDVVRAPMEDRVDWVQFFSRKIKADAALIIEVRHKVYPDIPDPTLPPSLGADLSNYEGTYSNPGYQSLTFYKTQPAVRIPNASSIPAIICADAADRTFPFSLELEHVSGEHFLAWLVCPQNKEEDGPGCDGIDNVDVAFAAEFRAGVQGQVEALGLAMEKTMSREKIWFNRI